jgi:hypothetical protein
MIAWLSGLSTSIARTASSGAEKLASLPLVLVSTNTLGKAASAATAK